jgi:hypothetical protein
MTNQYNAATATASVTTSLLIIEGLLAITIGRLPGPDGDGYTAGA